MKLGKLSLELAIVALVLFPHRAEQAVGGSMQIVSPSRYADREAPDAGTNGGDGRWQQVFLASDFLSLPPDYRFITQIAWRPDRALRTPRTTSTHNSLFRLSTTAANPPNLSPTFANNIGLDETVVFDGPLSVSTDNVGPNSGPKEFDYIITFETPFEYDPNQGNLLVDSQWFGMSTTSIDIDMSPGAETQLRWATNPTSRTGALQGGGIVHQFTFVPESFPGDFNMDRALTVEDINLLTADVISEQPQLWFDLDNDDLVTQQDRRIWVKTLSNTYFGDSNLDGEFNSGDLIAVFQTGQYEDDVAMNSTWTTGDWNGDAEFDSGDLVLAFQDGGYEKGPQAAVAAVPEPASFVMLVAGLIGIAPRRRRFHP